MKKLTLLLLFASTISFAQVFRIDSLPQQGILLDKGWKWHAGDNPDFAKVDFDDSKWESIDPTKDIFDLPQISKDGQIGWLRLRLALNRSIYHPSLALEIKQSGASEIYLNGKLIHRLGRISTNPNLIQAFNPLNLPYSVSISGDSIQFIAVRYALQPNIFYGTHFGMENKGFSVNLNTSDSAVVRYSTDLSQILLKDWLKVAVYVIMTILFFTLFLFFPTRKVNLYFSIYTLFLAASWIAAQFTRLPHPTAKFYWLNMAMLSFQTIGFVFMLTAVYLILEQKRSWSYLTMIIYGIICIPSGAFIYGWGWFVFGFGFTNLIAFDTTRVAIIAARNHKKGAWIIAAGGIFYLVSWFIFSLQYAKIIGQLGFGDEFLFDLAMMSISVTFAIFLGYDFGLINRSLQRKLLENETLSAEKQHILATQNETLERQVAERTAELEHKNRDLEIEGALEKVRSRTMAMFKSDELAEVATLLYQQISQLGGMFDRFVIGIIDEQKGIIHIWATDQSGQQLNRRFVGRLDEKTTFVKVYASWKAGDRSQVIDLQGEELREWIKYAREELGIQINEAQLHGRRLQNAAYFSQGYLAIQSSEPLAPEIHTILERFSTVFNLTYTRFLDLQKAEAQLREAQIEAALENVRTRSLAMQKSTELREVVRTVVERMTELGMNIASANIVLFNDRDKGIVSWTKTNIDDQYSKGFSVPYNDEPAVADWFDAFGRRAPLFTKSYTFDEKNAFWQNIFEYSDFRNVPADRKKFILDATYFSISLACRKNTAIQLTRYTEEPFSETDNEILKRFANVFEQAYTRFLDLQKAEANEREAIRQASLDRVRAEIASMRTRDDLQRITPLIWKELTTLAVPFIRCGVFIMDEATEKVHTYLSTPDGRAIASFDLTYTNPGITPEVVNHWRKGQLFSDHWDEAQFQAWSQSLVEQGLIQSGESYVSPAPPKQLSLYFLPFRQGMLYVGNGTPLTNDEIQLAQVLADAFSTAYARYQDFNELEETKLQVEKAFAELKSTQAQLIQKEKMASLGELTAGIAHEIQNPLNFVNNFSELSVELAKELKVERLKVKDERDEELENELVDDLIQNQEKINHHGKRASSIVSGMLEHSRASTGDRQLTDINSLTDEYLRLAYHGLRAKDQAFNATLETHFDENLPKIEVIPQDMGRVLLNLINNAFWAVSQRHIVETLHAFSLPQYQPIVIVLTQYINNQIIISVKDNGNGIHADVLPKIFQPFFTTKPTGQGTGLGLSLAYDIVTKGHGGTIEVESVEGEGTTFTVQLPILT